MAIAEFTAGAPFPAFAPSRIPHRRSGRLGLGPTTTPGVIAGRRGGVRDRLLGSNGDHRLALAAFVPDDVPATSSSMMVPPPLDPSSSFGLADPVREFEPVLNVEAAASFGIIAIVFALLQFRINAVSSATVRRKAALESLRKAESMQLAGGGRGGGSSSDSLAAGTADPSMLSGRVALAKREYEAALRAEMDLRTIAPGVRIVAPNDPRRDEEERAAAKRFLGWDGEEFGDEEEFDEGVAPSLELLGDKGSGRMDGVDAEGGMSSSAQLILFGVATMLIVLLWGLSFDPMTADQVFTSVAGPPPTDLPLSSWSIG